MTLASSVVLELFHAQNTQTEHEEQNKWPYFAAHTQMFRIQVTHSELFYCMKQNTLYDARNENSEQKIRQNELKTSATSVLFATVMIIHFNVNKITYRCYENKYFELSTLANNMPWCKKVEDFTLATNVFVFN